MPNIEHQDAAAVLDDFVNRVANLPAEVQFMQEEIADKDRQMQTCLDLIAHRDASIQKFIKSNGTHVVNPKEEHLRKVILENYDKIQLLQEEKCALAQKSQVAVDRHIRYLDGHIKILQDRGDFPTDPDIPSLLRPAPSDVLDRLNLAKAAVPLTTLPSGNGNAGANRLAMQQQAQRMIPAQMQPQIPVGVAATAPPSPAAALLNRQARESSAGAANKRQRLTGGVGTAPVNSSGLARHSSIGPGTPKAGTPTTARAGSAGPRTTTKASAAKKVAPHKLGAAPRKGKPGKSGLSRVKRSGNKNSPSSTNDSELSDADSASQEEEDEAVTPPPVSKGIDVDEDMQDGDDDENGDDKKYCMCQSVSYGDMVACDNDECPYEWFHWNCVGLKSEPVGSWHCPSCTRTMKLGKKEG